MISRLLVTGGRDYSDRETVARVLAPIFAENPGCILIHGDARGADRLCKEYAESRNATIIAYPADWTRFGKSAGPRRNSEMLKENPDLCIAFPGGDGTMDMVKKCQSAGIEVIFVS